MSDWKKTIIRKYATLRRVGFKEVWYKYSNRFFLSFVADDSIARKRENGLSIRYFRKASFPTPDEFNRMGQETFDVALALKGDIAVDIGAHVGAYAMRLAWNFRQVYAFEPNPLTYRILSKNIKENQITNIVAKELAVSNSSGRKTMRIPTKVIVGTTLEETHYDWLHFDAAVGAWAVSLDDYFKDTPGNIGFVKIDAENHELAVLKGMVGIIKKHHPIMSVEVHQRPTTLTSCDCNVCQWLREQNLSVELHGRYTPEMQAHWLIAK